MRIGAPVGALAACLLAAGALAAEPAVRNVTFTEERDRVTVRYDLEADAPVSVRLVGSTDGGRTFALPIRAIRGDAGASVAPGRGRSIEWAHRKDHPQGLEHLDVTLDVVTRGDRYLPIPIRGHFGVELDEDYLKDCLKVADRAEAGFLVLEVASPGGSALEMEDMLDLILEWRAGHPSVRVVAFVLGEASHAAAFFVAGAADSVFLEPGAWVGGSPVARPGGSEVAPSELEFPKGLREKVRALAEPRGISAALLEGVERPCRLAAALSPGVRARTVKVSGPVPPRHSLLADGAGPVRLAGSNAVLSGFAAGVAVDYGDLGRQLGHPDWASAGEGAREASRSFAADVRRVLETYESLAAMLREGVAETAPVEGGDPPAEHDVDELRELADELQAMAGAFPFVKARTEADLPGGLPGLRKRLEVDAPFPAPVISSASGRPVAARAARTRKRIDHVWSTPTFSVPRS